MCHESLQPASSKVRWLCAATLLLGSSASLAEDAPNILTDPFHLALGTFVLNSDTKVRLDGASGSGTDVDWEQTFGDEDTTQFRVDGHWRFADRHKVRFLWFSNERSATREVDREINWGDVTFPANSRLKGDFSFDIYELAYEYAFLRRDSYEVTGSIGLHYTDLAMSLTQKLTAGGGSQQASVSEEASVGAPLPVIGLRGLWALPHNFWIDASAQFFALSIDEYDGNLQDYKVVVLWQPKKWLGLGLGYNQFSVDVDVDADNFNGSLDWTYKGPMLSYSVVF
jgi:hypothetical protein